MIPPCLSLVIMIMELQGVLTSSQPGDRACLIPVAFTGFSTRRASRCCCCCRLTGSWWAEFWRLLCPYEDRLSHESARSWERLKMFIRMDGRDLPWMWERNRSSLLSATSGLLSFRIWCWAKPDVRFSGSFMGTLGDCDAKVCLLASTFPHKISLFWVLSFRCFAYHLAQGLDRSAVFRQWCSPSAVKPLACCPLAAASFPHTPLPLSEYQHISYWWVNAELTGCLDDENYLQTQTWML